MFLCLIYISVFPKCSHFQVEPSLPKAFDLATFLTSFSISCLVKSNGESHDPFSDRDQFQLGSLSHMINAKTTGYLELPDFPEVAPDSSVRNVEVSIIAYTGILCV